MPLRRFVPFAGVWLSALAIVIYFIIYFSFDYYYSKFTADFIALIGLSFMTASTFPAAYHATMRGGQTDTDRFIMSYWSIWTVFLFHRLWVIYLAVANTPQNHEFYLQLRDGPVSGLIAIFIGISAGYGAAAPFSGTRELAKRDLIIFCIAAGFTGVIAGIVIGVFVIAGWATN